MSYGIGKIMQAVKCPLICLIDGEKYEFGNGSEALSSLSQKDSVTGKDLTYSVTDIKAEGSTLIVSLEKHFSTYGSPDMEAEWIKEHVAQTGRLPNLFDGA